MVPPETAEPGLATVTQEVSASESDESEEYVEEVEQADKPATTKAQATPDS